MTSFTTKQLQAIVVANTKPDLDSQNFEFINSRFTIRKDNNSKAVITKVLKNIRDNPDVKLTKEFKSFLESKKYNVDRPVVKLNDINVDYTDREKKIFKDKEMQRTRKSKKGSASVSSVDEDRKFVTRVKTEEEKEEERKKKEPVKKESAQSKTKIKFDKDDKREILVYYGFSERQIDDILRLPSIDKTINRLIRDHNNNDDSGVANVLSFLASSKDVKPSTSDDIVSRDRETGFSIDRRTMFLLNTLSNKEQEKIEKDIEDLQNTVFTTNISNELIVSSLQNIQNEIFEKYGKKKENMPPIIVKERIPTDSEISSKNPFSENSSSDKSSSDKSSSSESPTDAEETGDEIASREEEKTKEKIEKKADELEVPILERNIDVQIEVEKEKLRKAEEEIRKKEQAEEAIRQGKSIKSEDLNIEVESDLPVGNVPFEEGSKDHKESIEATKLKLQELEEEKSAEPPTAEEINSRNEATQAPASLETIEKAVESGAVEEPVFEKAVKFEETGTIDLDTGKTEIESETNADVSDFGGSGTTGGSDGPSDSGDVGGSNENIGGTDSGTLEPRDPEDPDTPPIIQADDETNVVGESAEEVNEETNAVRTPLVEVKYHKFQVKIFFGSDENPKWDNELSKSIRNSGLSKDEINKFMNMVIIANGSKMLIDKTETENDIEELIILLQLHFTIERNLHRGDRFPSANVKVSDLIGLRNLTTGSSNNQPQQDPFVEAANLNDSEQQEAKTRSQEALNNLEPTTVIPQTSEEKNVEEQAKIWNNRPYRQSGYMRGEIYNNVISQKLYSREENTIGPTNTNDILGLARTNFEPIIITKTKSIYNRCKPSDD